MAFLDRFDAVLLDMNGTFMFGGDRLSEGEDFAATYRVLGGSSLSPLQVDAAIRACCEAMAVDYEDPARYDDFPRVLDVLRRVTPGLPDDEARRLEPVLGVPELGIVPAEHASLLHWLSRSHRLGLVANIWCHKAPWLGELERSGVLGLFRTTVFSSDCRSIKPSPVLFRLALDAPGVDVTRTVFVGDSLRCDIAGAKAAGLSAVWMSGADSHPDADLVVRSLLDLRDE